MPRKARIDAPGALHYIIIRGIERKAIFKESADRKNFTERLDRIIPETQTRCYGWALMTNHVHLKRADEQMEEKYRLQGRVISLQVLIEQVAHYYKIEPENLKSASKERRIAEARRALCYMAVRKLGYRCSDVSRATGISAVTVSKAVSLGSRLSKI